MSGGIVTTLIILGVVLIVLEIFVPGGILGLIGLGLVVLGIFFSAGSFIGGLIYVTLFITLLAIVFYFSLRSPKTRKLWKRLSLADRLMSESGYTAPNPQYKGYVGKTGRALTRLRPAGTADVNGERLDVVTEGGFIEEGESIKIVAVEGSRIIVRKEEKL